MPVKFDGAILTPQVPTKAILAPEFGLLNATARTSYSHVIPPSLKPYKLCKDFIDVESKCS